MNRKLKWKRHEYTTKYYHSETTPEFTVYEYDRVDEDGNTEESYFQLEFRHEQHFDTLEETKQWVEDFREWKRIRREK